MDQEINHSEIYLRSLKTSGGFTVPENYFENLEMNLSDNLLEPDLGFMVSKGFQVPESYFDDLEDSILRKVKQKSAAIIPLYQKRSFKIGVSIAAGLLLASMLFLFKPIKTNDSLSKETLSNEEIINHLSNEDINVELLCEAGWCNELDKLNKKDHSEMDNYLIDHSDENILIDAL